MRNERYFTNNNETIGMKLADLNLTVPRRTMIGVILMLSLLAFEMFNFDTTQYALRNLLGEVRFLGLQWASILAVAFCSIDFAGLVRLFTPEKGADEPKEVWYLMGAWLLGATMNAIMTWWAVSLTLLNHSFGNEVLSREQLLQVVPIFVAVLVWLTRILFIGAFTVAGEHIFDFSGASAGKGQNARPTLGLPAQAVPKRAQPQVVVRQHTPITNEAPGFLNNYEPATPNGRSQPVAPQPTAPVMPVRRQNSRIRQRPPRPNGPNGVRRAPSGIQASSQNYHNQ